ncbi:MAG: hypothetical protein JSS42_11010 [Proteobacteria bacterium]|uniref:hypothetical protein n=1 Tax=Rudaea sp. TaxID=2136325 RepID=UPI00321FA8DD|nr:hypothetical protein [Pseudomonadota bacterium]
MHRRLRAARRAASILLALAAANAHADLTDEIQVYDDSINRKGQLGLELHLNTTLDGRSEPDWPREIPPNHGVRATMEWSYGLTDSLEAGLYLPFLRDSSGTTYFAGPRVRLKWMAFKPAEGEAGLFGGLNVEVGAVNERLEQGRPIVELRPILGYRNEDWLVAFNPAIDKTFRSRYVDSRAQFGPGIKVSRSIGGDNAVGIEYYDEMGPFGNFEPARKQSQQLFVAFDAGGVAVPFNFGIGRGLNAASDKWTMKAIFEVPL